MNPSPPSVVVIGAGVSGLTAAHLLRRHYDVTLIEADDRLGGHAHTHDVEAADAGILAVDSGFIVHNEVTYPNLIRLFRELGVETQPTEMSMSVRCDGCGLEYCGARGLGGVFAQGRSLANPRFLRLLVEVNRFHRQARAVVDSADGGGSHDVTLGDFLSQGSFSRYFTTHFMIPVVSAVWSSAPETALRYPARYLFQFLANHGMLSLSGSHQWKTVVGGSRSYVEAVAKGIPVVRVSSPVRSLHRNDRGVEVRLDSDEALRFDRAVIATHPDTALAMLDRPTEEERSVLGAFRYSSNQTVLHGDDSILPRAERARAAWNYLLPSCDAASDKVLVSYDMNRLQRLPTKEPHVVTLNASGRIAPGRVVAQMTYAHPIYTPESVSAQARLASLNDGVVAFAGAYHGWGFHEDGCLAGVKAAESFGSGW